MNAGNLTDCADITISDNVVDVSISTDNVDGYLMDCSDDYVGVLITSFDAGN